MKDTEKTREQIASELAALRRRVRELEASGRNEEWFRRVVDTAYEGIWIVDAEGCTEYVNRRMAEMLGYIVEEMLGRSALDFVYEVDLPEAKQRLEQRRKGIGEQSEVRLCRRDGSELRVLSCTNPVQNENGETISILGMMTDITERQRVEKKGLDSRRNCSMPLARVS